MFPSYLLHFRSLLPQGPGYSFPCDARGTVDLDGLGERERNDYFYARAMVQRELAPPRVTAVLDGAGQAPVERSLTSCMAS